VRLAGQLAYLAATIAASEFAPTAQQREVAALLRKEMLDTHEALRGFIAKDLAAYNAILRGRGLRAIDAELTAIVF
jgi:hypothetical protein